MVVYLIYNVNGSYQLRFRLNQGDVEATSQLIPRKAVLVKRYEVSSSSLEFEIFVERLNRGELREEDLPDTLEL